MRIRVLPVLIMACVVVLTIKIADLIERKRDISEAFLSAAPLNAEENVSDSIEEDESGVQGDTGVSDMGNDDSSNGEKNSENQDILSDDTPRFSKTELEILKRLAKRREVLEQWEKDLSIKENVLNITQAKIDKKISELRNLKTEVENVLKEYEGKEDAKTRSLVKIYETMKPADAAAIFAELDMDTLLQIVDKMKEGKAALIIAKMQPGLAKELTVKFAERGKLPDNDNIKQQ